jgi:tetratricopeptide (TPR) repeat protein
MACGLPVIVTEGGATDDFVDDSVGWLLSAEKRSLGTNIDGDELAGEAFVLEPSVEDVANTMAFIVQDTSMVLLKGILASLRARRDWTWERSTLQALTRLDVLFDTDMAFHAEEKFGTKSEDGIMLIGLAEETYMQGNIDEAIALYNRAFVVRGLPEKYALLALHRLASITITEHDFDLVDEFLAKARDIAPVHPDTMYIQALNLSMQDKWEETIEILNPLLEQWKTLRFDSSIGLTLDMLLCDAARATLFLGEPEEALEVYNLSLDLNQHNADACFGASLCLRELGRAEDAHLLAQQAVNLNPDFEAANFLLEEMEKEQSHG